MLLVRNVRALGPIAVLVIVLIIALPGRQASAVTITIDGSMADWTGATASYGDPSTDAGGGSGDIQKVWLTADGTSVFLRWDITLPNNKNKITSDAFSSSLDLNNDTVADARIWVMFNAQGVATAELEKPIGSFAALGSAQQNCGSSAGSVGGSSGHATG